MASPNARSRSLRQAPTKRWAHTPSEQEKQVLSSYVFGYLTLEEANELLHQFGGFLITICEYQVTSA
jgi:hypothetical protein